MADAGSTVRVDVRVASGSLSGEVEPTYVVPHPWTEAGIAVAGGGTGAHLLLTAVACCLLNDAHREAQEPGVPVDGVLVTADGEFDSSTWATTAIGYDLRIDSGADPDAVARLVERVDEVAEIPRVVRGEVTVARR
jgi:uncharacterized OsmC-like protein